MTSAAARGLFVTGTDTEVGKTILCAALIASMRAAGHAVRAHKPAASGLDELTGDVPGEHILLGQVCELHPEEVAPLRYGPALSPHLAARLAGAPAQDSQVIDAARQAAAAASAQRATLIVEGVGGLLVPITDTLTVRDLAAQLGLPLLVAARPGLGTINHTLLTLESARAVGLQVRAVVLTPWPDNPSVMERSNRETIERLGAVEVASLAHVEAPSIPLLTAAGETLPWRRWLEA